MLELEGGGTGMKYSLGFYSESLYSQEFRLNTFKIRIKATGESQPMSLDPM